MDKAEATRLTLTLSPSVALDESLGHTLRGIKTWVKAAWRVFASGKESAWKSHFLSQLSAIEDEKDALSTYADVKEAAKAEMDAAGRAASEEERDKRTEVARFLDGVVAPRVVSRGEALGVRPQQFDSYLEKRMASGDGVEVK